MRKLLYLFGAFLLLSLIPAPVSAQAGLQGGSLEQQTGQTQNTRNVQSETAPLQQNNSSGVLSQTQPKSLSVFSSPTQTTPDATAAASPDLKTEVGNPGEDGRNLLVTLGALALIGFAAVITYRVLHGEYFVASVSPAAPVIAEAPVEEPPQPKPKKKKPSSKKIKKSKRRY